jgi:hypothetical protein
MNDYSGHKSQGARLPLFLLAAAVLCLGLARQASAEMASPASYHLTVLRASAPVEIDGRLDEQDWAAAEVVPLTGYNQGIAARQATECRLLWDDKFLYIAWKCLDTDIWSTLTTRDDTLYQQEVVEVFINPDGDRETYVELEVNPLGALWDGFILKSGEKRHGILAWNSFKLERAVWVEGTVNDKSDTDNYWSVELAVTLDELITAPNRPPKAGDKWRINLYRIDLPDHTADTGDYQAWSPVSGESYHDPDRFGEIIFSDQPVR